MISRRSFLAAIGAAGTAGFALTACSDDSGGDTGAGGDGGDGGSGGDAAKDPLPFTLGYIADGNGSTLVAVAEKLDLWAKHGLEPDVKVFTNGPLQIQALGTGDIDFGYIGPGALWLPMEGKASVVSLNSLGRADRVIAQAGISSLADLRGKTVGVAEGTSSDMILALGLEKAGMSEDDIERVAMDPTALISAFTAGQIDAAAIWYPHIETIRERVPDLVELDVAADFPELAFPAAQVAGPDIATEKPEELQRFQAVMKEVLDWAAENKAELPALLAEFLDAPEDSIAAEMEHVQHLSSQDLIDAIEDGTAATWLSTLNEMFVRFGKTDQTVDPSTYFLSEEFVQA